jgi:hypothetical protein
MAELDTVVERFPPRIHGREGDSREDQESDA